LSTTVQATERRAKKGEEFDMSSVVHTIGGMPVTTRLAMKMEDSLQAFAVRAACFIGELDVPFFEEFDGHDYGATHIVACLGDEPVGAVRMRWFRSFAMTERLAVMQRFRGHNVGQILLERCRALAASRGCNTLYAQVLPHDTGYWEKLGWRRLVPEATSKADPRQIVSMVKAVDPSKPLPEVEVPEAIVLRREPQLDSTGLPSGRITN
jgi:GNAT superfamily N-acetyltransferase